MVRAASASERSVRTATDMERSGRRGNSILTPSLQGAHANGFVLQVQFFCECHSVAPAKTQKRRKVETPKQRRTNGTKALGHEGIADFQFAPKARWHRGALKRHKAETMKRQQGENGFAGPKSGSNRVGVGKRFHPTQITSQALGREGMLGRSVPRQSGSGTRSRGTEARLTEKFRWSGNSRPSR